jgi:hypothetical protein
MIMSVQNLAYKILEDLSTGFEKLPVDLLDNIRSLGEENFITYLSANFPEMYVHNLLVAHREIWEPFTVNDWQKILISLQDHEIGLYTIISFLSKYQIVDSLEIYKNIPAINEKVRSNVLEYFTERPGLLRLHQFKLKNLLSNNVTWVDFVPKEDYTIRFDEQGNAIMPFEKDRDNQNRQDTDGSNRICFH